ncbi:MULTISPECIES: hypothetical protein, partial [Blautia]|uniref:hypothetical protein n=1 Tax=Blautia TaxID=572511 RepID=UPI00197A9464
AASNAVIAAKTLLISSIRGSIGKSSFLPMIIPVSSVVLNSALENKSETSHVHDNRYYTKNQSDDRYYTKSQINNELSN